MNLEQKQQEIVDEFSVYDDWIRESTAFDKPSGSAGHDLKKNRGQKYAVAQVMICPSKETIL